MEHLAEAMQMYEVADYLRGDAIVVDYDQQVTAVCVLFLTTTSRYLQCVVCGTGRMTVNVHALR